MRNIHAQVYYLIIESALLHVELRNTTIETQLIAFYFEKGVDKRAEAWYNISRKTNISSQKIDLAARAARHDYWLLHARSCIWR